MNGGRTKAEQKQNESRTKADSSHIAKKRLPEMDSLKEYVSGII